MKNPKQQPLPVARREGLLVRELVDEMLVYDLDRHKVHCLNTTAALVWRQCDGNTGVSEITSAIQDASGESLDGDAVWLAIEQLKQARLIDATSVDESGSSRLSRRELIKKFGIAAAVALPLVTTIVAPTAFGSASCVAPGQACTATSQCCVGVCAGTCA